MSQNNEQVMRMALEALEGHDGNYILGKEALARWVSATNALRAALAAQAGPSEPVAFLVYAGILDKRPVYPAYETRHLAEHMASQIKSDTEVRPLYTGPAPVCQPLTDSEITSLAYDCNALPEVITDKTLLVFARAIEAKIIEKGGV